MLSRVAHFYSVSTVFTSLVAPKLLRSQCISSVKEKVKINQGTQTQHRVISFIDPDHDARVKIKHGKLQ